MIKKERRCFWRSKAFWTYLLSNVMVFFLTLNILSMLAIGQIVRNMRAEEKRVIESKLYTVAEDMEMQVESMRRIALKIASLKDFRLDYFSTDKYREIEMLKRLGSYGQELGICKYFFMTYNGTDTIFTSVGTTMTLEVYFKNTFGDVNVDAMQELVNQLTEEKLEDILIYQLGDIRLLFYPLNRYAPMEKDVNGVLCFQVDEKELLARIDKLVGNLNGNLTICYRDFSLLRDVEDYEETEEDSVMKVFSASNNVKVYFQMKGESYFSWNNVFSGRDVVVFTGSIVFLILLGIFIAYWNWKPMRKLTEKYSTRLERGLEPDWKSIDAMIESLLSKRNASSEQLQVQYRHLREHTIRLIATGGYSDKVKEYMTLLDIRIDAPCYGIMECPLVKRELLLEKEQELYQNVEALSGDGISLYSFWGQNYCLGVLIVMEEAYQMEDATELLQSLLEANNLPTEVQIKGVYYDLKQIEKTDQRVKETVQTILANEAEELELDSASEGYINTARRAVTYIKDNYTNSDLSLDMVAEELEISSTYLCRIIKQELNISYKEYLTNLRINEAKRLLMDKNMGVAEVCLKSGYNNVSYFIKVFQKYTGMTPAKYRNEYSGWETVQK